jgi:hypothetical protein
MKKEQNLEIEENALHISSVSSSFYENLVNIPHEINGHELRITKEDDGRWIVAYETDLGYLKAKNDRYNECIHGNVELKKAVEDTLKWLHDYL